jgi:hypothetical protein
MVRPNPADPKLTREVDGLDQAGAAVRISVPVERPLTLFLNKREIVTMMTISDYPDCLAVGYLLNQNMLRPNDEITGIEYDDELEVVVVRTASETNFEDKLRKKTLTSGCAQGTAFGDLLERFERITLDPKAILRTSWLFSLSRAINLTPSLYLEAGAIHGCVLCERDVPLIYMEDVGRHKRDRQNRRLHVPQRHSARGQAVIHDWPADIGNGHQDRAYGNPNPDQPQRLYGLGRRSGAPGEPHSYRPRKRQPLHGTEWLRTHHL